MDGEPIPTPGEPSAVLMLAVETTPKGVQYFTIDLSEYELVEQTVNQIKFRIKKA